MKLRELTFDDAARCAELEEVLFPGETPWSEKIFCQEMAGRFNFYLGVEDDKGEVAEAGTLLGYAGIGRLGPADDPEYEIHTIGVDPAAQRRGVARMMMDNIIHIADLEKAPVYLEVRVGNEPAIALYEVYGFSKQGIRRNYYQPSGADAHTMSRPRSSERNNS